MELVSLDEARYRFGMDLKALREAAGLSQQALADLAHTSQPQIDRLEKGYRRLTKEWAERLAPHIKTTPQELLFGTSDGEPVRVPPGQEFDPDPVFEPNTNGGVSTEAPYQGALSGAMPDIDVSAGAGPGGLSLPAHIPGGGGVVYDANAVRGEFVFPDYVLREFTRAGSQRVHFVRVRGDSMESTLSSGDRVLVDTTDTAIGQGGVFVLLDPDGEVLVKRLRKLKGGRVSVESDNPKQGPDEYGADEIRIIGRAVGRICRL